MILSRRKISWLRSPPMANLIIVRADLHFLPPIHSVELTHSLYAFPDRIGFLSQLWVPETILGQVATPISSLSPLGSEGLSSTRSSCCPSGRAYSFSSNLFDSWKRLRPWRDEATFNGELRFSLFPLLTSLWGRRLVFPIFPSPSDLLLSS